MPRHRLGLWCAAAFGLALIGSACSGSEKAAAPVNTPPPGAVRVDESRAGTVKGRILFEGTLPETPIVRMGSDPFCARENPGIVTFNTVSVSNGGLDNVFVYVKDGLGNYYFDTPTEPVKLDNQGCKYVPRVLGMRVGQPLEISNDDGTMHNVNAMPKVNRGFNFALTLKGMKQTKTFTAREVMVLFKCDVHPWMNAFVGVMDHPYYAVSAGGGNFELKNVPPGAYTVEAWHEKLGTQTQQITLADKESKAISFTFKSGAATN